MSRNEKELYHFLLQMQILDIYAVCSYNLQKVGDVLWIKKEQKYH